MAVITISRQWGSFGDDVAHMLCDKLGYQYFDKKMMTQVGHEMGLSAGIVDRAADYQPHAKKLLERWFENYGDPMAGESVSWRFGATDDARQGLTVANLMDIINAGYKKGNVVIVGRGGMAALQNKPDVLHVRIQAPLELRIKRLQQQYGWTAEETRKKVKERDLSDVEWIKRYFGLDSHDPQLFDLIINTTKTGQEAAVDLIVQALNALQAKAKK